MSRHDRPHERARDEQEGGGRGELRHQEEGPDAPAAAGTAGAGVVALQQRRDVDARGVQRRHQAEEHRRRDADGAGVEQHVEIELDRESRRLGQDRPDEIAAPDGEQQSSGTAGEREQDAFREQQPDQARPSGAVGHPDRDFLAPRGRARQQEVGDVRTAYPQDEPDHHQRQHDDEQELDPFLRGDGAGEPLAAGRGAQRLGGKAMRLASRKRGQLRVDLFDRTAVSDPPEDAPAGLAGVVPSGRGTTHRGKHTERHPQRRPFGPEAVEGLWRDAANGRRRVVDQDGLTDGLRIAAEGVPPELEVHDHFGVRHRHALVLHVEEASPPGADAEHGKVLVGHGWHHTPLHDVAVAQPDANRLPRGDAVERAYAVAQVAERRERDPRADRGDAIGLGHAADRLEKDGVDDAEHRGVQPDAGRQREYSDGREDRLPPPATQRVADVRDPLCHLIPSRIDLWLPPSGGRLPAFEASG